MLADSYKYSQPKQYPEDVVSAYYYIEARGGEHKTIVWDGMQYYIQKYLMNPITKEDVQEAKEFAEMLGEPFEYDAWMEIIYKHNGYLPVRIKALPEGTLTVTGVPLASIESTDPEMFWIAGFVETLFMKVWYPTTIATRAYEVRKMLEEFADKYSDSRANVPFQYHNFGDRGASSVESAAIGGMAHLTQFMGTDNFNALRLTRNYYNEACAGYSIPASEHSTVTSWGEFGEFEMYNRYLESNKGKPIVACVLDSYNIYDAVDYVTSGEFKDKVESQAYPVFVQRPDSGNPEEVITKMLNIMMKNGVSYTRNTKDLIVFNKYRIIWGDGINIGTIRSILEMVVKLGFAPDNFAFGSGGDLMQNCNRDTLKFAIKCSSVTLKDGSTRDVFKDPITDQGKTSKKGKVVTYTDEHGFLYGLEGLEMFTPAFVLLYENGKMFNEVTFADVRGKSMM